MVDKILKGQRLPEPWSGLSMLVMLSEARQRHQLCGHARPIMRVGVEPGGRREGMHSLRTVHLFMTLLNSGNEFKQCLYLAMVN